MKHEQHGKSRPSQSGFRETASLRFSLPPVVPIKHIFTVLGLNDLLGSSPAVTSKDSVNQSYKDLSGGLWRTLEDIFSNVLLQSVILPLKPTLVLVVSQLSHATIYDVS